MRLRQKGFEFYPDMHPRHYRTRLFLDFCRALGLPSVALSALLWSTDTHLHWCLLPLAYLAFAITWAIGKGARNNLLQSREACQLDARPIPRVVGKWPGNIDVLLRMLKAFRTSYVLDVYLQLFEEYHCTTLNTRILWCDNIITMDQEHSKFVLATGFQQFWRGRNQKERMEMFLGEGIFNRDDEMWKMVCPCRYVSHKIEPNPLQHRSIARPFFARERISDFEDFERYTSRTLSLISGLSSSGQPCEVQDLFARFTLDAASEFLFGRNLDTLSATLPIPGKTAIGPKGSATHDSWGSFAQAFEQAQQIVTTRARIGYFWPLFELFEDKTSPHTAAIRRWLDPIVKEALKGKARSKAAGVTSPVGQKTFMQHLADSTEDPVLIRDQLLSMLLASRDTTACLLTFVVYFMAVHPEVARKLRAEALQQCGAHGAPTYESIRNLKYMRAVINETLRLFPPVPLNVRECRSAACALPPADPTYPCDDGRPLYMPRNTTIMYLPLLIQRNPALWGPDADTFDPERWLDPGRLSRFLANPSMYAPFSAGPRICIGQEYAFNEASYLLVRLLQQFDTFTLASDVQPEGSLPPTEWKERRGRQAIERVWPQAAMTLYIKGGLWVRFANSSAQ
ncbi:hypothetical protein HGRIS_010626 [Hohenbuehelia grisea]|uniref:Cytochrome P450 n=1 Tax=Hohenbuehelia grisea TaxID=104357 RepID=A0ABR3IXA7_9AGAR